jgi:thioredoxin 1
MFNRLLKPFSKPKPARPPADSTPTQTPPPVVDVTDADFASVVLASTKVAVVDFWAEWCEPCQIMSAYVGFLAQELGDPLLVAALDVDENPVTPAQYHVMGLPTLLVIKDGQEVDRIVGIGDYEQIKERIGNFLVAGAKHSEPSPSVGEAQLREEFAMWETASDQNGLEFEHRLKEEPVIENTPKDEV